MVVFGLVVGIAIYIHEINDDTPDDPPLEIVQEIAVAFAFALPIGVGLSLLIGRRLTHPTTERLDVVIATASRLTGRASRRAPAGRARGRRARRSRGCAERRVRADRSRCRSTTPVRRRRIARAPHPDRGDAGEPRGRATQTSRERTLGARRGWRARRASSRDRLGRQAAACSRVPARPGCIARRPTCERSPISPSNARRCSHCRAGSRSSSSTASR